ncbi:MAG: BMP family ABC transporter substrate-binding protein [Thermoprotei archaeon]
MSSDRPVSRRDFIKNVALVGAGLVVGGAAVGVLDRTLFPAGQPTTVTSTTTVTQTMAAPAQKLKVAWVYVGPIGDYGWTYAHDVGRKIVAQKMPFLETAYVESVAEDRVGPVLDDLVAAGNKVIFTTSFGYMDATIAAGERYPNVIFEHCSGYKRSKNVGTYFAELYQVYYLCGLIAGKMTKTNKLGYVAAHPTPEVIRHINAFHLGAKEANPNVTTTVVWINAWYDPTKARAAANTLIDGGADILAFTEDSPTVLQVAKERGAYSFGHYSDMSQWGGEAQLASQVAHWDVIYEEILARIYAGVWRSTDIWWKMGGGYIDREGNTLRAVDIENLNPKLPENVKNLVLQRRQQIIDDVLEPFTGPIYDRDGKLRIEAGRRATHDELWNMYYFLPGIIGELPSQSVSAIRMSSIVK